MKEMYENLVGFIYSLSMGDYFFFIGDVCGNGGTIFAKTYGEQLANQKEYLSCY